MGRFNIGRTLFALAAVSLAVTVTSPPVAAGANNKKLASTLEALWETVFRTPTPQNPFVEGGNPCVDLGGIVAPFASDEATCTVKPGTKVFVTAWSSECSNAEPGTVYFAETEAEMRQCARDADDGYTLLAVTVDGKPVPVTEVETGLLAADLPADNIFGDFESILAVAHGWVALLPPLTPGTHEIVIHVVGTHVTDGPVDFFTTTTVIVEPGR
jgi:hypothetical protein